MISSTHTRTVASADCVLSGLLGCPNGSAGNLAPTGQPRTCEPCPPGARQSFPTRRKFPATPHAIGSLLFHTDLVRFGERTRCVIVDDNRDFLDAAARLLEHQGISVVAVATSSAEGLQCVENLRPDVTLVDIDLGEESGFDVVEQLHRNGSGAAVPTILISTHAEEDFAELVASSPALAFIPKASLSGAAIRDALGLAG
jgi:CheY-like chemotaxis protein